MTSIVYILARLLANSFGTHDTLVKLIPVLYINRICSARVMLHIFTIQAMLCEAKSAIQNCVSVEAE